MIQNNKLIFKLGIEPIIHCYNIYGIITHDKLTPEEKVRSL